jgi:hypothetical protein
MPAGVTRRANAVLSLCDYKFYYPIAIALVTLVGWARQYCANATGVRRPSDPFLPTLLLSSRTTIYLNTNIHHCDL